MSPFYRYKDWGKQDLLTYLETPPRAEARPPAAPCFRGQPGTGWAAQCEWSTLPWNIQKAGTFMVKGLKMTSCPLSWLVEELVCLTLVMTRLYSFCQISQRLTWHRELSVVFCATLRKTGGNKWRCKKVVKYTTDGVRKPGVQAPVLSHPNYISLAQYLTTLSLCPSQRSRGNHIELAVLL